MNETILDWSDEGLSIERQGNKYYLIYWDYDGSTNGWSEGKTSEHLSLYGALKEALAWVDGNAEMEAQHDRAYEEYLESLATDNPTADLA